MAVVKLVEPYAVTQLRKDVRDSLTMAGEECIVLQLFHPGDDDALPCGNCGDDVYKSPERDCPQCYGTMFEGGVRLATRSWALFTDHEVSEQVGARGVYRPDMRHVQLEAFPWLNEHDIVVRVRSWDAAHKPLEVEGCYELTKVTRRSLRTGSRFGQYSWDTVAQLAQLSELDSSVVWIAQYPIVGQVFEESIELLPASPAGTFIAIQPDVKVVYFPFEADTGGVLPASGAASFVFRQDSPAAVWTISHSLGFTPDVTIIVGGEEVEADVDYPNNATVIVTFNTPQSGVARLT